MAVDVNNGTTLGNVIILPLKGEKGDAGDAGDYNSLANKPSINGVVLTGNKTSADLGVVSEASLGSLENRVSNSEEELVVLDARMDAFANLPEGSTSGDAELIDIRVGENGITYPTAGDAVRGQVGDLNSEFKNFANGLAPLFGANWVRASINGDGSLNTNTAWRLTTSNILTIDRDATFTIDSGYQGQIALYNASNVFISRSSLSNGFTIPANSHFRVSVYKQNESVSDNPTDFYRHININAVFKGSYNVCNIVVNNSNYASYLPDLNNATKNGAVYIIVPSDNVPLNLPKGIKTSWYCMLRVTTVGNVVFQELISETGTVYYRYRYNASSWDDWTKVNNVAIQIINSSNYATLMPDLNNVVDNGTYTIVPSAGAMPANMPANIRLNWYCTLTVISCNGGSGTMQEIVSEDGNIYRRYKTSATAWDAWTRVESRSLFVVKSDGTGEFSSVLEAITTAVTYPNSTVYVDEGEYDVIEEYKAKYGSSYFDNYTGSENPQYQGINLYNGITLIFSSKAKLVCHYTGNNALVRRSFSCLNMFHGDASLINVTLDCANIRYAVHDDPIIHKDYIWKHEYYRCKFKIDYTNEITGINIHGVIGGGLGKQSDILIEDCIFEMIGYGNDNTGVVGYHNCVLDGSKSSVVIRNNYFRNGTAYATWYGESTEISQFLVNGNKLKSAPFTRAENADYDIRNVELLAWNNDIS